MPQLTYEEGTRTQDPGPLLYNSSLHQVESAGPACFSICKTGAESLEF